MYSTVPVTRCVDTVLATHDADICAIRLNVHCGQPPTNRAADGCRHNVHDNAVLTHADDQAQESSPGNGG